MLLQLALAAVGGLPPATQPLLAYVMLNTCLMVVEIGYGAFAGSLGLVCDGVHLAINCFGIAISLVALEVSKRPPTLRSSYGFDRVHVLAAFTNALFLAFVALFLSVEAVHRFGGEDQRAAAHADHVSAVASAGLAVNLAGLGLLGVSSRRSRESQRARLSKRFLTGPDAPPGSPSSRIAADSLRHAQLLNLQSVLLHAICDVLNSVGVLISSFLVRHRGWAAADPLFALLVAALIMWSVCPLLFSSGQTLLQVAPLTGRAALDKSVREISTLNGVLECDREHTFAYAPNIVVTTMNVRVRDSASESELMPRIHGILASMSQHVTVQISKD